MAVSLPSARPGGRACPIPGVVDVWCVDLGRRTDGLAQLLCEQERARAGRITDARRRARWTRSRGALRELLARYLDADPHELRFVAGAHGKPRLQNEPRETLRNSKSGSGSDEALRFNLSHSGDLMLLAVTTEREVGVDVERVRERHTDRFLRAWTTREARVKCRGIGLGATPFAGEDAREGMWTVELDVGRAAFAALALDGRQECELSLLDWTG